MNKSDLVELLSDQLGKTKKETADFVDAVLDTITARVAKGEKVSLSGFGVFEKQSRAARVGRNPRTGQTVRIKATSVPKFRPGVDLKQQVAGKKRPARKNAAPATTARKTATKAPVKKAAPAAKKVAPAKKAAPAARKTAAPVRKTAVKAPVAKKTTTRTATKAPAARKTTTAAKKTTARKTTAR